MLSQSPLLSKLSDAESGGAAKSRGTVNTNELEDDSYFAFILSIPLIPGYLVDWFLGKENKLW